MDRGPPILGDLDLNGHIKHFTEYFPPSRPSHAIAYICVRLFSKKQGNKLRVIRIDLFTEYFPPSYHNRIRDVLKQGLTKTCYTETLG